MEHEDAGARLGRALQNGTGVILSKLAVISIPFLLTLTGFLLNTTIAARDQVTRQEIRAVGDKIDALAGRVDVLSNMVRATTERASGLQGDIREVQGEQRAINRRLDERGRR